MPGTEASAAGTGAESWPWHERLLLPKFGQGLGLHRTSALAAPVLESGWGRALDALKVTGSNGKGSVAAMLAALLAELGVDTGLYTSPHLFAFNERIAVRGRAVSNAELDAAWAQVQGGIEDYRARHPGDTFGAFEAMTALALAVFARAGVRAVVAEAGIGGRYDPVRVLPGRVCALTSLELEHTALLGRTLEEIAFDKADICPAGGTLVAAVGDGDVRRRLAAYCRLRGVHFVDAPAEGHVRRVEPAAAGLRVDLEVRGRTWRDVELALHGPHQARNALVALLALEAWLQGPPPRGDTSGAAYARPAPADGLEAAARRALARVTWPGRFQQVRREPDVFVDVGHTPDALRALAETVRGALGGRRLLLVTGVSRDKNADGILSALAPLADEAVCTQAHHKGRPAGEVLAIVRRFRPALPAVAEPDIVDATARAVAEATASGATVLIAGGLFLAAEAVHALRGGDPRSLHFF